MRNRIWRIRMPGNTDWLMFPSKICSVSRSRKRALTHLARISERYFSDDVKMVAEVEELELEYLFK